MPDKIIEANISELSSDCIKLDLEFKKIEEYLENLNCLNEKLSSLWKGEEYTSFSEGLQLNCMLIRDIYRTLKENVGVLNYAKNEYIRLEKKTDEIIRAIKVY